MRDLYFAACAENGGIYHYKFNDGIIEFAKKYDLDKPMYIATENNEMYVILRDVYDGESAVVRFDIEKDGSLCNMSVPVSSRGKCACHLCVENGNVYTANYISGTVSLVGRKTVVHSGYGPNKKRQDMPHCHYINFTADKKYLLACDLGNDTIYTYDRELNEISKAKVGDGQGCRHLAMSHKYNTVYCVNELGSSVTVFEIDDGKLAACGTYGTLGAGFEKESIAAAIKMSADEKYLYVSNRGEDSVCIFEIYDNGKKLRQKNTVYTGGAYPRDFEIVDNYMLVTNERTNNVTVFRISGENMEKQDETLEMPSPLCVIYR